MSFQFHVPIGRIRLRHRQMISKRELGVTENHFSASKSEFAAALAFAASIALLFWFNRSFLKPLAMASLFAVTIYPVEAYFRNWVKSTYLRAALLTSAFAVTFILPIGIVAFLAADAGLKSMREIPDNWTDHLRLDQWIDRITQFLPIERADLVRVVEEGLSAAGKAGLKVLQNLVADLPKLTVDNTVIVLALFVFLAEGPRIKSWLERASPLRMQLTSELFGRVSSLARSVILATVVSGLAQSMLLGAAALVSGFERPLLITMSAFVLSFIPVIGTAPVVIWMLGSAALAENWTQLFIVAAFAGAAGLSDNLIRPAILSGSARLHPLLGFIAAFGGLESIGFYGLFLGPVIAGALLSLIDLIWIRRSQQELAQSRTFKAEELA